MKEGREDNHCDVCSKDFPQTFPIAETRDEYAAARKALKGGYVVNDDGHARRKISCPDKACKGRVSVTILEMKR